MKIKVGFSLSKKVFFENIAIFVQCPVIIPYPNTIYTMITVNINPITRTSSLFMAALLLDNSKIMVIL